MDLREVKFLHAFNLIPGVGPGTLRQLRNHFGSLEAAWHADESELQRAELTPQSLKGILWKRPSLHPDKTAQELLRSRVWMITEEDTQFPLLLREISKSPLALYGRGTREALEYIPLIAVVGPRKPTQYGLEVTDTLVERLVMAGFGIVSGLAYGIDARAHEATLTAGGVTIAVLGSGVDDASLFPQAHHNLAERIAVSHGAVIAEYAPGTPALKEHFPQRNRIISGISRGVVVIEAPEKSGALITARFAIEQNREVFAVPGSIFSLNSKGTHKLIQEGAKLTTTVSDILEELGIEYTQVMRSHAQDEMLGADEKLILDILAEPLTIDAIKERTGIETAAIAAALSLLELKNLLRQIENGAYQKISS